MTKQRNMEISVSKSPETLKNTEISIDFPSFNDLFLSKLENKKKLKSSKKYESFSYTNFHNFEQERKLRSQQQDSEIFTSSEPPVQSRRSRKSNVSVESLKSTFILPPQIPVHTESITEQKILPRDSTPESITEKKIFPSDSNRTPVIKTPIPFEFPKSTVSSIQSHGIVQKNSKYIKNSFKSDIYSVSTAKTINSYDNSEDDEKRELLFKFQLLSSKHNNVVNKYPFTMKSDLKIMKSTYNMILKQLTVNTKVDKLHTYLYAGFMACEHFLGKIGFDMEGFSKQQISSAKSYESLLVELGEKEYSIVGGMDNWCVEIRLLATLAFNAAWFIIAKSITNKTNFDLLSFMNVSKAQEEDNIQTPPREEIVFGNKKMREFSSVTTSI
nr:MAG: hypothetical protein DiTV3a_F16ORF2 [Diabrotica toursvirus 3a]